MDGDWGDGGESGGGGGGDGSGGVVAMGLNRTTGMSARSWARNSSLRRDRCVSPLSTFKVIGTIAYSGSGEPSC